MQLYLGPSFSSSFLFVVELDHSPRPSVTDDSNQRKNLFQCFFCTSQETGLEKHLRYDLFSVEGTLNLNSINFNAFDSDRPEMSGLKEYKAV